VLIQPDFCEQNNPLRIPVVRGKLLDHDCFRLGKGTLVKECTNFRSGVFRPGEAAGSE
jgi:hypothetical protein